MKEEFLGLKISRRFYSFIAQWRLEPIFDLPFQTLFLSCYTAFLT